MLDRIFGRKSAKVLPTSELMSGNFHLAIVGEASYQEELRRLVAGRGEPGARVEVRAVLKPEPNNRYDSNAVAVYAESGGIIGYLSREDAEELQPLIINFVQDGKTYPSCMAMLAGGYGEKTNIGVWLDLDVEGLGGTPPEKSVLPPRRRQPSGSEPTAGNEVGGLRTGASAHGGRWTAFAYGDIQNVIKDGRAFLENEQDPLERHYAFISLEAALYKCRDTFPSALTEFEAVCERHHLEMAVIRPAILTFFGGVPLLPTYKQMAILKSKSGEHASADSWCRRGLEIYGGAAMESEGTTDLSNRLKKLSRKVDKGLG